MVRIEMIKKGEMVSVEEINNIFTGEYNEIVVPEEYDGEKIKVKHTITPNIAHLYTLYKSMGKWFIDENVFVLNKLAGMCNVELTMYNFETFEYYLYIGGNNLQKAKKIYIKAHY